MVFMWKALVTGGAGFIGSHLVDRLMAEGHEVVVSDNLSSGSLQNIGSWLANPRFNFIKGDLKEKREVEKSLNGVDLVFHFAANPEVRVGETDPSVHFNENLVATSYLLEAMRRSGRAKTIIFSSTSTVYGEASVFPTPEDYGPMRPISTYGASKLGCEALISSYAFTFGLRGLILRFANIVGSRANHGVITDFIRKLRNDPKKLEILGDSSQKKSYLHISDCVEAIVHATNSFLESRKPLDVYNVGSTDQVSVGRIAEIVAEEMSLRYVEFSFTGGVDGGRGWLGDVKTMLLDIRRLTELGWSPKYSSAEAVKIAAKEIWESSEICDEKRWRKEKKVRTRRRSSYMLRPQELLPTFK